MTRRKINDGLTRSQRYHLKHKEERNRKCREYAISHRDEKHEYDRKHYENNREESISRVIKWNKSHPKQRSITSTKYWINNHERLMEIESNVRRHWTNGTIGSHKRRGIIVSISSDELREFAQSINTCQYCGQLLEWNRNVKNGKKNMTTSPSLDRVDNDLFIDHIWQHDLNTRGACTIICSRCNVSKQDRTLSEYLIYCSNLLSQLSNFI